MSVESVGATGMVRVTLKPDQVETVRHDLDLSRASYTEAIGLHKRHGRDHEIEPEKQRRAAADDAIRQCDEAKPGADVALTWPIWLACSTIEMAATLALENLDSAFDGLEPGQTAGLEQSRATLNDWLTILLAVYEFVAPSH